MKDTWTAKEVADLQTSEARLAVIGYQTRLREEFLRMLTEDSETLDARRREFNQAIFDKDRGYAIWTGTDLDMVMTKFDKAVKNLGRRS